MVIKLRGLKNRTAVVGILLCAVLQGQLLHAATDKEYNVLFICIDDLNDWVGALGGHPQAITPHIDTLAAEGQVFEKAYCASPMCGPSRTALLYGVPPHVSGSYGHLDEQSPLNIFGPEVQSIPMVFQQNNYHTMGAGKTFHMKFHDDRGWDSYLTRASSMKADKTSPDYNDTAIEFGPVATDDDNEMGDMKFTRAVIDDLEKNKDKPFFLSLGLKKPHMPWNAPQKYYDMYDLEAIIVPEVPEDDLSDVPPIARYIATTGVSHPLVPGGTHEYMSADPMLWKRAVRAYLATSTFADACVGEMIKALKESGQYENTIMVLWGDHGWHLGEKNHWRKHALWEPSTKTTFIMRVPGMTTPGARCASVVSLSDIYPTLLELCNLPKRDVAGNSLVPLLNDAKKRVLNPALMTFGPGNHSIRYDHWRYTQYCDGSEELYDHNSDPEEYENLAGNPEYNEIKESLKQHIPTQNAPDPSGDKSAFATLKRSALAGGRENKEAR